MSGNDDNEAMRLAFEQYMMGGIGSGSASATAVEVMDPRQREEIEAERMAREEEARWRKVQAEIKKEEKVYWHIFKRFANRVKNEWLDIDEQAHQVIKSIAGIRRRLPSENKMIHHFKDVVVQKKDWACHGFRQAIFVKGADDDGSTRSGDFDFGGGFESRSKRTRVRVGGLLTEEDAELALSHDLIQHEKMMSGLRSLFAQLSECHEALLRMFDEMTKHHLECSEAFHWSDLPQSFYRASSLEGLMNDVLSMLSLELYRKQCMVHEVLEKVRDDLIGNDERGVNGGREKDLEWEDLSPQGAVDRCCRQWPKGCEQSQIDILTLRNALNLLQG